MTDGCWLAVEDCEVKGDLVIAITAGGLPAEVFCSVRSRKFDSQYRNYDGSSTPRKLGRVMKLEAWTKKASTGVTRHVFPWEISTSRWTCQISVLISALFPFIACDSVLQ